MCGKKTGTDVVAFVEQWEDPTCMFGCTKPLATGSVYEACKAAQTLLASGCLHPCMFAPAEELVRMKQLLEICGLGTR